ncbi:MAG: SRPBCC family protein [Burkholderiales bacterium]|nr:SRPBCC family protein [Burkholderiales bacterium]
MLIDGQFDVAAAPAVVLAHLFDARLMASCLPGCESLEEAGEDRYRAVVAVALAGVKARFDLQVEVTERLADGVRAITRGEEGGNASTLQATSEVRLTPNAGGTHVDYRSEVAVTGRLGRFALGMMKKKAQSLGDEFAANLQRALAATEPPVATTPADVAPMAATPPVAAVPVVTSASAAPATAARGSWWRRIVQWLRARFGPASPGHP